MGLQKKISIIVPVYNNEEHLKICLDTLVGQTMRDIEIICVDDASKDASLAILKEYEKKDDRVLLISHSHNQSASQARKDGCLQSGGEYILFVDGDDYLLPDACERLYEEMKKEPVDILHFGTYVLNYSFLPQTRIQGLKELLRPVSMKLRGRDVFDKVFAEERYGFNIWNKMYNGDVCRRAFAQIEDGNFPKAQDKYAYMAIALEADSYRGIPAKYYVYRFGSGVTGHKSLSIDLFYRYCTMGKTADAMERLLQSKGLLDKYNDVNQRNRKQLLDDVAVNWLRVRDDEKEKGLELAGEFWKENEVRYVREKKVE